MAKTDWLARADWRHHTPEFGAVVGAHDDGRPIVAMEYVPSISDDRLAPWNRLRELWLDLPPHPNILEAVDRLGDRGLLLRYAALDWQHARVQIDATPAATKRLATWGVQLTEAFENILSCVSEDNAGWFTRAIAWIDIGEHVRFAFLPASPNDKNARRVMPPEIIRGWPRCEDRGLVYVVGTLLSELSTPVHLAPRTQISSIIERCVETKPSKRFQTLVDLRTALANAGAPSSAVRDSTRRAAWEFNEAGIGWLMVDRPDLALKEFDDALCWPQYTYLAEFGRDVARERLGLPAAGPTLTLPRVPKVVVFAPPEPEATIAWSTAEPEGVRLETDRAFADALNIYRLVRVELANQAALATAMARCHLQLGEPGPAIDYAQRALAVDPHRVDAHSIKVRGLLFRKQLPEALTSADELIALSPDHATAHYLRGRCLFALGRLAEARDSFERACVLQPQLVEAMLLRREVDRAIENTHKTVGHQGPIVIDVPEHLAELRSVLVDGGPREVIALLQRVDHEIDPVAQLLLGRCLAFEGRFEEATTVFDHASALSAEHRHAGFIGKASALLELGRAAEALAVLDVVHRETPDDIDAIEARGRALEQLGRRDEAATEFRWLIAIADTSSDLRVRAAAAAMKR